MTEDATGAVTVMLVDDHQVLRQGLAALVDAADGLVVVAQAGDGAEALTTARQARPQVVLMDLSLPGTDSLGISERTVKVHVGHVFRAIGVADRTSAALWAREHLPQE